MSGGEIIGPEGLSIDEILYIADAMADRSMAESQIVQGFVAEAFGKEPETPTEEQKLLEKRKTVALLLKRCSSPGSPISIREDVESMYGFDETNARWARELKELIEREDIDEEALVSAEKIGFAKVGVAEKLHDGAGLTPEEIASRFSRTFEQAMLLASEKNVDIAQIFREESLYEELMRRTFSPEEVAENMLRAKRAITADVFKPVIDVYISSIPDSLRNLLTEEEIEEFTREVMDSPEFKKIIEQYQSSFGKAFVYSINRIWGYEALLSLPEHIKAELVPQSDEGNQ